MNKTKKLNLKREIKFFGLNLKSRQVNKNFRLISKKRYLKDLFFKRSQKLTKNLLNTVNMQAFTAKTAINISENYLIAYKKIATSMQLEKQNTQKKKKIYDKRIIIKTRGRLQFKNVVTPIKKSKFIKYNFREKHIIINVLLSTNMFLGKLQDRKTLKNDIILNYIIGIRNKHAIFNVNLLTFQLRRIFNLISNMYFYKQLILVNLVSIPKLLPNYVQEHITHFSKPTFLVSQIKWIGGTLTNYKTIYKQLYSNLNSVKKNKLRISFFKPKIENKGLKLNRSPKLPALLFSAGDCHWALNEAKKLKIKTIQCLENDYKNYFADINLAISTSPFPLIMLILLLKESTLLGNSNFKNYTLKKMKQINHFRLLFVIFFPIFNNMHNKASNNFFKVGTDMVHTRCYHQNVPHSAFWVKGKPGLVEKKQKIDADQKETIKQDIYNTEIFKKETTWVKHIRLGKQHPIFENKYLFSGVFTSVAEIKKNKEDITKIVHKISQEKIDSTKQPTGQYLIENFCVADKNEVSIMHNVNNTYLQNPLVKKNLKILEEDLELKAFNIIYLAKEANFDIKLTSFPETAGKFFYSKLTFYQFLLHKKNNINKSLVLYNYSFDQYQRQYYNLPSGNILNLDLSTIYLVSIVGFSQRLMVKTKYYCYENKFKTLKP